MSACYGLCSSWHCFSRPGHSYIFAYEGPSLFLLFCSTHCWFPCAVTLLFFIVSPYFIIWSVLNCPSTFTFIHRMMSFFFLKAFIWAKRSCSPGDTDSGRKLSCVPWCLSFKVCGYEIISGIFLCSSKYAFSKLGTIAGPNHVSFPIIKFAVVLYWYFG